MKKDEMSDASGLYGGEEKGLHVFVGKPEGRTLFGRPARRLDSDIKIEPEDRRWEELRWIYLAQDSDKLQALFRMIMNLQV
jgi:hypothetical protein